MLRDNIVDIADIDARIEALMHEVRGLQNMRLQNYEEQPKDLACDDV